MNDVLSAADWWRILHGSSLSPPDVAGTPIVKYSLYRVSPFSSLSGKQNRWLVIVTITSVQCLLRDEQKKQKHLFIKHRFR